jgi:hypothetical protein
MEQIYLCLATKDSRADRQNTVHITDLGSAAAPENERQAPYSNVGQVSTILAWFR